MHLAPMKKSPRMPTPTDGGDRRRRRSDALQFDGQQLDRDYLKVTGELDVDLRSNIAAEARAKIVYERLITSVTIPAPRTPCSS